MLPPPEFPFLPVNYDGAADAASNRSRGYGILQRCYSNIDQAGWQRMVRYGYLSVQSQYKKEEPHRLKGADEEDP